MPDHPTYRSQSLDHLGLVAGLFDELGIGDVLDQATHQNPALRDLTVGEAVKARVLNGLGFINHVLDLRPRFFQHKPPSRLISPRVAPTQLNDDALRRALETLDAGGVTELYRLIAATAVQRLGLAPRVVPLDRTSFHGDGRDNSDEEPDAHVMHITRGDSRDQRPDLNPVLLDLMVEHQAGMPVLMKPRSGNKRDAQDFGQLITAPMAQLPITSGTTCLVADGALDRAANRQKLAETRTTWITRVPATVSEAQAVLAQADPPTMAPLTEDYRDQVVPSSDGGVEQRWVLLHSAPRQPQAQRTVDNQLLKHSEQAVKAFKKLCRTAFACAADAQPALATCAQACRPPSWPSAPSALPHAMPSGGDQATAHHLTRSSIGSKGRSPCGSPLVRPVATKRVVAASPPMHSTTPSSPRRSCELGIKAKPRRNAGFASCKTRSFWPLHAISTSLHASWRCCW